MGTFAVTAQRRSNKGVGADMLLERRCRERDGSPTLNQQKGAASWYLLYLYGCNLIITDSVITICYISYIEYKYIKPFKSQITELSIIVFYLLLPYQG